MLQRGSRDTSKVIQSLLPLEKLLTSSTYVVQDSFSLADIVLAVDLKQTADTVRSHNLL